MFTKTLPEIVMCPSCDDIEMEPQILIFGPSHICGGCGHSEAR